MSVGLGVNSSDAGTRPSFALSYERPQSKLAAKGRTATRPVVGAGSASSCRRRDKQSYHLPPPTRWCSEDLALHKKPIGNDGRKRRDGFRMQFFRPGFCVQRNEATHVHPNYCVACPVGRTIQLAREARDDAGAVHGVLTSNSTLGAFCGSIDGSVCIERRPHGGWRLDLPARLLQWQRCRW